TGSNRRPTPCKGAALPAELSTHIWGHLHWNNCEEHNYSDLFFSMQVATINQLTASFNALPGRNFGTRASLMSMASPVRGLRPTRAARSETENVPKPTSVTASSFLSVVLTASMNASRARVASAFDKSALAEICSMSSVLFI